MPLISHCFDPAQIKKPTAYHVPNNTNVLDWLIEIFGIQDNLSNNLACSFILNGKEIFRSDHENKDESLLDFTISNNDNLVIVNRPASDALGLINPIFWVTTVYAATAAYTALSVPQGTSSSLDDYTGSPNGRLNAGTNTFRPYEAIPEVFGRGISYPDFLQPSYFFYENNLKQQVGLFGITRGKIDVNGVYVGSTNIESISNSYATIYQPGEAVDPDYLSIHTQSTEVDGQTLEAYDSNSVSRSDQGGSIEFSSTTIPANGVVYVSIDDSDYDDTTFQNDTGLDVGDYLYIRSNRLNGVFEILSILSTSSPFKVKLGAEAWNASYSGQTFPANGDITVGVGDDEGVLGAGTLGNLKNYVGWFELAGDQAEEIWINWNMPNGLRSAKGGTSTMTVNFYVQSVVDDVYTGNIWTKTVTLKKNTIDGQFQTVRFTKANTPGLPTGRFAVRANRVTKDLGTGASQTVKLESAESVVPYSDYDFDELTTMLVVRKATLYSADQAGKKINVDYTRKLPTYNRTTSAYSLNTLTATQSFADAAAYTLISAGNETTDTVDLAELYGIYDGLSDSDLGEFSATFDDANLSMGERVSNICKVARVISYHDGRRWRFGRDEIKTLTTALFNRRSTIGNQSKQSWQPQRSDDSDSVRIIYVDPDSNTEAYIDRAFNLVTGEIIEDEVGFNLKEINLLGCRNLTQATNRADLEIRRLAYQRRSVTEVTSREAINIVLLDRVGWVDVNDIDTFDGEIMGINGNTYDTSERFEPVDGEIYVVFITDNEGYPSNTVQCFPRSDTEFGFTATGISDAYVATGEQQIGSRYFIANSTDLSAAYFTMTSRTPNNDGTVTVELAEYRTEMYEKDGLVAAGDAPIVPEGLEVLSVTQGDANAYAEIIFKSNGLIETTDVNSLWYTGGDTSGVGSLFQIRVTEDGDTTDWVTMSSDVSFSVADLFQDETPIYSNLFVEIRQTEYTANYASGNVLLIAARAEDVALPTSMKVINSDQPSSTSSVSFSSNGTYSTSGGVEGSYTTVVNNIGKFYQAKATTVSESGVSVTGSLVGTWVTLSNGGATWTVSAGEDSATALNIEVREVADITNTATTAVDLVSHAKVTLPSTFAYAGTTTETFVTFKPDGTYEYSGGEVGTWFIDFDNIGTEFEIYVEDNGGTGSGLPIFNTAPDEWFSLSSNVIWGIESNGADAIQEFSITIRQVRDIANTATMTLTISSIA